MDWPPRLVALAAGRRRVVMKKTILFTLVLALAILAAVVGWRPVPPAAAAPAAQSGGVVYTDDGKSCVRDVLTVVPAGGGGGEQPLFLFNSNAGDNSFVVRELPHRDVTKIAYIRPAGQLMVTLGSGVIRVWETATGREKAVLRRPDPILQIAVSSGRPLVAGVDESGRIWLWDLSRATIPEPIALATIFLDPYEWFRPLLALSPDGRFLAVSEPRITGNSVLDSNGEEFWFAEYWAVVSIYDAVSGRKLRSMEGSLVSEPAYHPNGIIPAQMANGHAHPVTGMEFSPNSQALLTTAADRTMRLWSVASGEHLRCFELADEGRQLIAFSPDGREIASVSVGEGLFSVVDRANIALWNALTGQVVRRFAIPVAYVELLDERALEYPTPELVFRPDGAAVALSFRREARVWAKQTGQLQAVIRSRPDATIPSLAYSPDSRHLALAGAGPSGQDGVLIAVADHAVTRAAAVATSYIEQGLERGLQGKIRDMVQALREAERVDPFGQTRSAKVFALAAYAAEYSDLSGAARFLAAIPGAASTMTLDYREWNGLCWFGSLATTSDLFLNYCDKAVAAATTDAQRANGRDSRGVARMYNGNYAGAIEDFTYFASYFSSSNPQLARQRRAWIDGLRRGDEPYEFFVAHELWNE